MALWDITSWLPGGQARLCTPGASSTARILYEETQEPEPEVEVFTQDALWERDRQPRPGGHGEYKRGCSCGLPSSTDLCPPEEDETPFLIDAYTIFKSMPGRRGKYPAQTSGSGFSLLAAEEQAQQLQRGEDGRVRDEEELDETRSSLSPQAKISLDLVTNVLSHSDSLSTSSSSLIQLSQLFTNPSSSGLDGRPTDSGGIGSDEETISLTQKDSCCDGDNMFACEVHSDDVKRDNLHDDFGLTMEQIEHILKKYQNLIKVPLSSRSLGNSRDGPTITHLAHHNDNGSMMEADDADFGLSGRQHYDLLLSLHHRAVNKTPIGEYDIAEGESSGDSDSSSEFGLANVQLQSVSLRSFAQEEGERSVGVDFQGI